MPWAPDYVTTAQLKSWLRIGDTADDTLLAIAATAASRDVDLFCGRQFGVLTGAEGRYYAWDGQQIEGRPALEVDDLQTTTGLVVATLDSDGAVQTTLTLSTDFDLWPWNAAAEGLPWTHVVLRSASAGYWSRSARSALVTAKFGWTAVPSSVVQATLLVAAETFARRNAPFGIAGSPDTGSELRLLQRLDVDAARLLSRFKRRFGAV